MANPVVGLIAVLEADFRQLSHDARKAEGFAGFFGSSDSQPEVKEAAERAVMKVRAVADHPAALDQIRASKELLKPLQLACDSKSARLISQSLSIAQKMLSNDALSPASAEEVIPLLVKVEKINDESVQLRTLQTALTLLQSPLHPVSEEGIGTVLGLCFRTLTQKGRKEAVMSTAAATVRQSVAIVFSYVDVPAELARLERVQATGAPMLPASPGRAATVTPPGAAPNPDAPSPALIASQRLLEDLIAIATGAPPGWLKTPSLPRTFVLEVLDFALATSSDLFRALPDFESTLSLRISQLLQAQLQDYLDAGAAGAPLAATSFPTFKATLRCMRTLLLRYHPQLGGRCGTLIQTVLRGLSPAHPLFQRIAVGQLVRQLLGDPFLVYYLFSTYDMQRERKLDAVHALVRGATDVVDLALKSGSPGGGGDDEVTAESVAQLYQAKALSKDWNLDQDYESASIAVQQAYLAMLAIDSLLAFMSSAERLTDVLVEHSGVVPPAMAPPGSAAAAAPGELVRREVVCAVAERTWRAMLAVLSQMLARCNGEAVVLALLKGYQVFTQACGMLELAEPRDAFLGALCDLALSDGSMGGSDGFGSDADSPRSSNGQGIGGGGGAGSPRRTLSTGDAADAGIVLSPKNVQAMRTLFNIAHRLSNALGPAWALVLETLNTLDRVLNSPRTTTQEVSSVVAGGAVGGGGASSDLAILSAAAAQLFECTRDMRGEAVVALLSGLRDVSLRHLPQATQVSQPKMFALSRMVDVLLYNTHRIYDLWGIFLAHVLEVVNDPKPPVRAAAVDALGRAIVGALATLGPSTPESSPAQGQPLVSLPAASPGSTGGLEHMLLVALEALHNDDREKDVRAGVLRVLLNVLQRHGERLTDGWTPVFRLLAVVPGQGDPETITLGFQCLELTCNDYLASLPLPRLRRCLEVAAAYGQQQEDVNVSLTTISLLWNAGDMLGRSALGGGEGPTTRRTASPGSALRRPTPGSALKEGPRDEPAGGETEEEAQMSPGARAGHVQLAAVTPAQSEELLDLIFAALQAISQDPRPEVRNSGARTLFAVVVAQGPRLSRQLWERCLWEMLFPLLRHAFHMSATSSREESEATLLGKSRGQQVRLVVHHSRNTEQKRWDETVVVALGGMARLLRAHLPAIAGMDGMGPGWEELMVVAESCMAGGRKEVALAAISLVGGVLGAHGRDESVVTPAMWRRAVRAVDVGVEAATSAGCLVPVAARVEMVAMVAQLYTALRPRFSDEETLAAFGWAGKFCRNPWSEDDASNLVQTMGMPPVQKAALALLPALSPEHAPHLQAQYIRGIVRLVQPAHVAAQWKEQMQAEVAAAGVALTEAAARDAGGAAPAQDRAGGAGAAMIDRAPSGGLTATPGPPGGGANGSTHPPPKQAQHRFAITSAFLEKVLDILVPAYEASQAGTRAATLADVAQALGVCMELRYSVYQEKIWRSAAATFNRLVPSGLAAVNAIATGGGMAAEATDAARAWSALAEALENFLLGSSWLRATRADGGAGALHRTSLPALLAQQEELLRRQSGLPVVPVIDVPSAKAGRGRSRRGRNGSAADLRAEAAAAEAAAAEEVRRQEQAALPVVDVQQARADAELELAVLDTLTDGVLTACGPAPLALKRQLIDVVHRGVTRPKELSVPQTTTGSNFSHVCVRKMYVLCSRGAAGGAPTLLQVAQLALPPFLARADAMLRSFAEEARPGPLGDGSPVSRPRLDEIICVLEVLATMSLSPAVADAALPADNSLTTVVAALRARPGAEARGRERTHLLLLYDALCGCVTCKEARVREMVRDVLGLAGAELGLGGAGGGASSAYLD